MEVRGVPSNMEGAVKRFTAAWLASWPNTWRRARGVITVIATGGAVVGGVVGYWNAYRAVNGPAPDVAGAAVAGDAGPLSIVVLPFSNLTGDAARGDFADGLTASVTADLSRIGDAFVVGAGTALAYKDKAVKAQQVGRELGVRFVLQGNVQRSADKIRIQAQLTDSATNAQLWSETFDGDSGDLFALQDQVTTLIGSSMGRELVVRAARDAERRRSSPTVTDLLLQARALQIRPQSAANWRRVEALCRQAIALDPAHAEAMLLLAKSLALQARNFFRELGAEAWVAKVDEAAELSERLRASLGGAADPRLHEVLGLVAQLRGDFDGALRAFRSRVELEPKSIEALVELAGAYYWQAQPEPALELLARALALDPPHPTDELMLQLARTHFMLAHYDAAIEWGERARASNPSFHTRYATLAAAYAMKGDRDKAAAAAVATFNADPGQTMSAATYRLDFPLVPLHPAYKAWAKQYAVPAMRAAGFPE